MNLGVWYFSFQCIFSQNQIKHKNNPTWLICESFQLEIKHNSSVTNSKYHKDRRNFFFHKTFQTEYHVLCFKFFNTAHKAHNVK